MAEIKYSDLQGGFRVLFLNLDPLHALCCPLSPRSLSPCLFCYLVPRALCAMLPVTCPLPFAVPPLPESRPIHYTTKNFCKILEEGYTVVGLGQSVQNTLA